MVLEVSRVIASGRRAKTRWERSRALLGEGKFFVCLGGLVVLSICICPDSSNCSFKIWIFHCVLIMPKLKTNKQTKTIGEGEKTIYKLSHDLTYLTHLSPGQRACAWQARPSVKGF